MRSSSSYGKCTWNITREFELQITIKQDEEHRVVLSFLSLGATMLTDLRATSSWWNQVDGFGCEFPSRNTDLQCQSNTLGSWNVSSFKFGTQHYTSHFSWSCPIWWPWLYFFNLLQTASLPLMTTVCLSASFVCLCISKDCFTLWKPFYSHHRCHDTFTTDKTWLKSSEPGQ